MDRAFSLLVVCSANVCRSAYADVLLRRWALASGVDHHFVVTSAGVAALPGQPMCLQAAHLSGVDPTTHAAREVNPTLVVDADLIVTADRSQRGALARLVPSRRSRLFTLRQAADLGMALAPMVRAGDLPEGAPALPDDPVGRLEWLVGELDAARGALAARPEEDADIVDRHGPAPHRPTLAEVSAAIDGLTAAFDACLGAPRG